MFIPNKIELSERAVDILSTLRSHPDGLTTVGLYKLFHAAGNTRWKNTTAVSSNINYLRERDQYVSTHGADGGSIHKITELGLAKLAAAIDPVRPDPPAAKFKTIADLADSIISDIQSLPDEPVDDQSDNFADYETLLIENLEDAFESIQAARSIAFMTIASNRHSPPFKIADKPAKLAVLERIEGFVRDCDAELLRQIRADLEQLEAE